MTQRPRPRIVFLDFDGVLNTWHHRADVAATLFDRYGLDLLKSSVALRDEDSAQLLVTELVHHVNRLVTEGGATVVASTEWRKHQSIERLTEILRVAGATFEVRSATPVVGDRAMEINVWLARYYRQTGVRCQYVAIDRFPTCVP